MLVHPEFDPVIAHIAGPLSINWYGLSYLLAFAFAFGLAFYRAKRRPDWNTQMVSDLVFFGALGVMLGGRIGYVLFYQFDQFLSDPTYLFRAWEGGMSFHGGFIGVMIAMAIVSRKFHKTPFQTLDFIAPCVPTGLFFGRIGNYINGELWGRVSDGGYSWLMAFPQAVYTDAQLIATNTAIAALSEPVATENGVMQLLPRHPSQLYEAAGEGLILFILLWWFSAKPRPRYAVSAVFLIGYGVARFSAEFFRQPDADQTFRLLGWMTKGQYLTLPMIIIGFLMLAYAYNKSVYDWSFGTNSAAKK